MPVGLDQLLAFISGVILTLLFMGLPNLAIQQTRQRPAWHQNASIKKAVRLSYVGIASFVLSGVFQNLKGMNHSGFLLWLQLLSALTAVILWIIVLVLFIKGIGEYRRGFKSAQQ